MNCSAVPRVAFSCFVFFTAICYLSCFNLLKNQLWSQCVFCFQKCVMKPDQQEQDEMCFGGGESSRKGFWRFSVCKQTRCAASPVANRLALKFELKPGGRKILSFWWNSIWQQGCRAILCWLQKLLLLTEGTLGQSNLDLGLHMAQVRTAMGLITWIQDEMVILTYLGNIKSFPALRMSCLLECSVSHIHLGMQNIPILLHA